jgi:signal transduction histidine kinase
LAALSLQVTGIERAFEERESGAPPNARERERVHRAVKQVERLSRLIDQLLEVSQIAERRLVLERQTFDLGELVLATMHGLEDQAARVGSPVTVHAR